MGRFSWKPVAAGVLAWAAACFPVQAADDDAPMQPTAGVYAFLPFLVLDLDRRIVLNNTARQPRFPLTECSDARNVCLKSSEFNLSFPRHCGPRREFFAGDSRIVASFDWTEHVHLLPPKPRRTHIYFDPDFPHYAFYLDEKGLLGIIFDPLADLSPQLTPEAVASTWQTARPLRWARLTSVIPLFECW